VDVEQQLLGKSASGNSLPNVPVADVPVTNVPLPRARPDGSDGKDQTSPHLAEGAMVVQFGLRSGACLVHFRCSNRGSSGLDYYKRREVFKSRRVYFIPVCCNAFIIFIV